MYFKPLKIFIPLSGIIALGGAASAVLSRMNNQPMTGTTLFLFVAAIQVAALGLLADLLVKRGR
jgi:hypothetical protein